MCTFARTEHSRLYVFIQYFMPWFERKNQRNSLGKKGSKDFTAFDLQKPVKNRNTTNVVHAFQQPSERTTTHATLLKKI